MNDVTNYPDEIAKNCRFGERVRSDDTRNCYLVHQANFVQTNINVHENVNYLIVSLLMKITMTTMMYSYF